uniref:Ribosomal protein S16 n=1 Tax=Thermopsis turkestanica TaxID=114324 RepID=A0A7S8BGX2_9FABA|nr:ribosomal protein S16 [Thermopsis turkestanica]QPB69721.1 ribosomal protein S16 [Thermopsis turkestanica]
MIPADTLLIELVLTIPTNLTFFEPCSNWILLISLSKIYLRSCSNLLIFTNLRYLPLINESTRAPSCTIITIYIINTSPVPQTTSFSETDGTEQTMSSQEHPDFYILEKKK